MVGRLLSIGFCRTKDSWSPLMVPGLTSVRPVPDSDHGEGSTPTPGELDEEVST